jgi:hypothetical protein
MARGAESLKADMSQEDNYTIANDWDPDGDILHGADPLARYLTYLDCVRAGAVGDCGFTLEDFRRYIADLRK